MLGVLTTVELSSLLAGALVTARAVWLSLRKRDSNPLITLISQAMLHQFGQTWTRCERWSWKNVSSKNSRNPQSPDPTSSPWFVTGYYRWNYWNWTFWIGFVFSKYLNNFFFFEERRRRRKEKKKSGFFFLGKRKNGWGGRFFSCVESIPLFSFE